ncbi:MULTISPECIES: relaxase/mobilization nuclease domain-containing protein [unclassified Bradyrhizobium]|uniref:relaxase/mobilization nuclease domain-containing protein n=1 Tax=unclassified Bradyrhizobium TaxID=2631580 RepID=UPI001FFA5F33|nr:MULTISPECIES: relaxase/mobilization nuclease domain-containing protein [unclassified Bradyrhizobium]
MSRRSPRPTDLASELPPISYVWETPNRRPRRAEWDIPDPAAAGRLTPAMRAKLERIVRRAPEVMVKITGRTKSVAHLKSHLAYITRNGELDAETEQGTTLAGRTGLKDLQQQWDDDAGLDNKRRRDGSLSVNIILSMPAGTDAVAVKDSARAFAIESFGYNHDYVFVQHLDDKHPHVHLTVRSLSHDGKRLNPRKADLQAWRERFAGELRLRGIAAEATPRRTRGRARKADRGAVLALRKRKITPEVERLARKEVLSEVRGGRTAKHPWSEQIKSRQDAIRRR